MHFCRVTVPARLLSAVGSITVHLAVCDATGVTDVIDSGQVLVLPPDSARELQHVFEQMTLDVQDSFYSPTPHSSHAERFRQNPPPWSHLLPVHEPVPAVSAAPGNEADTRTVSAAEARNAALYSYQHLLLPVVHLMSAVLQGAAAHHRGLSSHRQVTAMAACQVSLPPARSNMSDQVRPGHPSCKPGSAPCQVIQASVPGHQQHCLCARSALCQIVQTRVPTHPRCSARSFRC